MKRSAPGFTLIELMITVAIVAILAAVAVPSYMASIRKSRRSDATTSLTKIQLAQETWRLNHSTYTGTLSDLGLTASGGVYSSTDGYYTLAITPLSATSTAFTATATATSGKSQASDTGCTTITLTVTNGGNTVANTPSTCWSK